MRGERSCLGLRSSKVVFAASTLICALALLASASPATAASWSAPVDFLPVGAQANDMNLDAGPDGTVAVVWTQLGDTSNQIKVAIRKPGARKFSTPVNVAAGSVSSADVAVGPDGRITVVWLDLPDLSYYDGDVFVASKTAKAASFASPQRLTGPAEGVLADDLSVDAGPDGDVGVVWRLSVDSGSGDYPQASFRQSDQSTFSVPAQSDRLGTGTDNVSYPQVAVGPDGIFYFIWLSIDDGYIQSVRVQGVQEQDQNFGSIATPQLAAGPDGSAGVIWGESGATKVVLRSANASSFGSPVTIGQEAVNQALAIGGDDASTAVFSTIDNCLPDYSACHFGQWAVASGAIGTPWQSPSNLLDWFGSYSGSPQVAAGPDGYVTLVYPGEELSSSIHSARRAPSSNGFTVQGSFGPAMVDLNELQLAVGGDGLSTALWMTDTGTGAQVHSASLPYALPKPSVTWSGRRTLTARVNKSAVAGVKYAISAGSGKAKASGRCKTTAPTTVTCRVSVPRGARSASVVATQYGRKSIPVFRKLR